MDGQGNTICPLHHSSKGAGLGGGEMVCNFIQIVSFETI